MPKITEIHLMDITPEKFLENCSPVELRDIDHLIQQPRFQAKMKLEEDHPKYRDLDELIDPNLLICK